MKKIKLTQNKYALVDNKDYVSLSRHKWYADRSPRNNSFYAVRQRPKSETGTCRIRMHTEIMNPPIGLEIDHIDGNGLNNQRSNLRICSGPENRRNRGLTKNSTSGFKGVNWHKLSRKWIARIQVNGNRITLGRFVSKEEAYKKYCVACIKYHGKFAKIK